jgi:hypothetical protein
MNRKEYNSDTRYAKVLEQMDLLGIMDVSTTRQSKNGTIVWKLPIKNYNSGKTLIEVASFSTGYVRNQNSGYSNYQLNKRCENKPEYFKLPNGDYRKFTTRGCKLIPVEIDRLEYLISYCLKNYYIKHANFVADGEYVPKWRYDNLADAARLDYESPQDCGHYGRIQDLETRITNLSLQNEVLQNKLEQEKDSRCEEVADFQHESSTKIRDLENKLDTIKRIADYETI